MQPMLRRVAIGCLMVILGLVGCVVFNLIVAAWGAPGEAVRPACDPSTRGMIFCARDRAAPLVCLKTDIAYAWRELGGAECDDGLPRPVAPESSPATSVTVCTCVEGPLADEVNRLRTQVRLLTAEKHVNDAIDCKKRKGKK